LGKRQALRVKGDAQIGEWKGAVNSGTNGRMRSGEIKKECFTFIKVKGGIASILVKSDPLEEQGMVCNRGNTNNNIICKGTNPKREKGNR
jgi:hypothetical protein